MLGNAVQLKKTTFPHIELFWLILANWLKLNTQLITNCGFEQQ